MLVLVGTVACGGGSTSGESAIAVATEGGQPEDVAMAADIRRYFKRNASGRPWYDEVESIGVVDGVITIDTTLDLGEPFGRANVAEICGFIQGSDVADFTPGHTVLVDRDERIVCPCRRLPGSDPALTDESDPDTVCRLD
jgi:hypothetical protein